MMRPRMLSTPATSKPANGTRVMRSGTNTSCTLPIGRPNSWPPMVAVTYSITSSSMTASRRLVHFGSLLLQCRDQAPPIEFCDIVVQSRAPPAFDRLDGHHGGKTDDRHLRP